MRIKGKLMIHKKVIATAAETHWTLIDLDESATPLSKKQSKNPKVSLTALLKKIGFSEEETNANSIDILTLDTKLSEQDDSEKLKIIFQHLYKLIQEKGITPPTLNYPKQQKPTTPAVTVQRDNVQPQQPQQPQQEDSEAASAKAPAIQRAGIRAESSSPLLNWYSPLLKARLTDFPKSQLQPILLPTGQVLYQDSQQQLRLRVFEENGDVKNPLIKLPLEGSLPSFIKYENQKLIILDNNGNLYLTDLSHLTDTYTVTQPSVVLKIDPENPFSDIISQEDKTIILDQQGTLLIVSNSTTPEGSPIQHIQSVELDEEQSITCIRINPQTQTLYYSVINRDGYSCIKSKNTNPEKREKSKIISKRIAGTVQNLSFDSDNLFFQVTTTSIPERALNAGKSNLLKIQKGSSDPETMSAHTTTIGCTAIIDGRFIATGANDIHILGLEKTKHEGMLMNTMNFPSINHVKFENTKGRNPEKGETLQLIQRKNDLLTLRKLEDGSYALFKISPEVTC